MEEIKETPQNPLKQASEPNITAQERTTYPYETIKASIEMVRQIVDVKGTGQYASKKEISIILSKAEGTLVTKLSSCVQYGLLVNKFGVGYIAGDLYTEYVHPVYNEDKKKAVLRMLYKPSIYNSIISELNGKVLPNEAGIINLFRHTYKLLDTSAERAAKVFQENLKFAEVVDSNSRLRVLLNNDPVQTNKIKEKEDENVDIDNKESTKSKHGKGYNDNSDDMGLFRLPIPLPGNRLAFLEYPRTDITRKDISVIKLAIAFIEGSLPDVNEDNN